MVDYPITFRTSSSAKKGDESWESSVGDVSVPEEFGGTDDPSPEKLFAASLENCVLATFKTIAERKGLEFDSVEASSETVLDRGEGGRPEITESDVEVEVYGVGDVELAREVAGMTEKNCFIHRSVTADVEVSFSFD